MNKKILPIAMSALLLNNCEAMAGNLMVTTSEVSMMMEVSQSPKDSLSVIEKGVKKVIAKQLNLEEREIKLASDLIKDLGADSLDVVEIVMGLENEYHLKFSDDELNKIKKVSDIVAIIERKKK